MLSCPSKDSLIEFMQTECDASNCLVFRLPSPTPDRAHLIEFFGFDGQITNDDCAMDLSDSRKILGQEIPSLYAYYETRWTPPHTYFCRLAAKYPHITMHMKVMTEDEQWPAPAGWFRIEPLEEEQASSTIIERDAPATAPSSSETILHSEAIEMMATWLRDNMASGRVRVDPSVFEPHLAMHLEALDLFATNPKFEMDIVHMVAETAMSRK
jgi:hypothetical protein